MSADLIDQPPESEALAAGLEAARERELDARDGVPPVLGVLSVTLPAAPGSREARLSKLAEPIRVTREFFDNVVNACWLLSMRGAPISPAEIVAQVPGVFRDEHLETLGHVLASEKMRLALLSRGIDADRTEHDGLTPEMIACIRMIVDPTLGLTLKQRLKAADVTYAQYQGWQSYPPFREALTYAGEGGLKGAIQTANTRLQELVDEGDLKGIQYLHQLTGYFTPGKQQNLEVQHLIEEVMTIVLRTVKDPQELMELAGQFRIVQERMRMGDLTAPGAGEPGAMVTGFGERAAPIRVQQPDQPAIEG